MSTSTRPEFVRDAAAPQYARAADGRVGEVMDRAGTKVWLRLQGSSYETDVPADTVTPCDADGRPLDAKPASNWYARIVDGRQSGIETAAHAASIAPMSWVNGTLEDGLHWTSHDPGTRGAVHVFRLEPISDEEAAEWRARHPSPHEETRPCDA